MGPASSSARSLVACLGWRPQLLQVGSAGQRLGHCQRVGRGVVRTAWEGQWSRRRTGGVGTLDVHCSPSATALCV